MSLAIVGNKMKKKKSEVEKRRIKKIKKERKKKDFELLLVQII